MDFSAKRRFTIGALFLFLVLIIGTGGYYYLWDGRYGIIKCLYMTVITISTVGYREVLPVAEDPGAMLFTIGLIILGMGTLMYFVTALASSLVEGHLADFLRRKRMESKIAKLQGHTIICGAGKTGRYVALRMAQEGKQCVLVDKDEESLKQFLSGFENLVFVLQGDVTQESVLELAGINRARGLVAALYSDQDNLYLTLTAKQMNPRLRIVAKANSEEAVKKLTRVGADRVISPTLIGGYRMFLEIVAPDVSDFLDALLYETKTNLTIGEMKIRPDSSLVGLALKDANLRSRNILVLGLKHPDTGEFIYAPDSSTILRENMTLIVLGEHDVIRKGL